ncbi:hypothetical protein OAR35_00635 [bacterium]|nr:hypothetical protein [bacterium]MDC0976576.1 hypothetical protein [bacterium]
MLELGREGWPEAGLLDDELDELLDDELEEDEELLELLEDDDELELLGMPEDELCEEELCCPGI